MLGLIGVGSGYTSLRLAGGGKALAQMVGARPLQSATNDKERQLRNVVEGLLLSSMDDHVRVDELPDEMLASSDGADDVLVAAEPVTSLEDSERKAIVSALSSVQGNLARAARVLGVSRSTLYRKVEHYKLTFRTSG